MASRLRIMLQANGPSNDGFRERWVKQKHYKFKFRKFLSLLFLVHKSV